jgi:long-subunit fatty acid transport protein
MASVGYQVTEQLRVRVEYEYQNWSVMDIQRITNTENQAELLLLERFFNDTNAYRARLDYALSDALTLHGGLTFEEGATPEAYHEAGLAENDQIEGGAGVTYAFSKTFELHTSFLWQHFFDRTITNSAQKPTTNGAYTDNRQYLANNLLWRWGGSDSAPHKKDTTDQGDQP